MAARLGRTSVAAERRVTGAGSASDAQPDRSAWHGVRDSAGARAWSRRRLLIAGTPRSQTQRGPHERRADRREADRRRRQHLDQPDRQGPGGRAAAAGAEGLAVRGVLRGLLQPQGRPVAVRPQGLLARLRLRHRRQGRLVVTNNHVIDGADEIIINFHDGIEAQGRQGARQGHQDRPRAAQGDAEEAAAVGAVRLLRQA